MSDPMDKSKFAGEIIQKLVAHPNVNSIASKALIAQNYVKSFATFYHTLTGNNILQNESGLLKWILSGIPNSGAYEFIDILLDKDKPVNFYFEGGDLGDEDDIANPVGFIIKIIDELSDKKIFAGAAGRILDEYSGVHR